MYSKNDILNLEYYIVICYLFMLIIISTSNHLFFYYITKIHLYYKCCDPVECCEKFVNPIVAMIVKNSLLNIHFVD